MNIPFKKVKDGITVEIRVEPRAAKVAIQGVMGDSLRVKLTSPPVDGAANRQLVELLSREFNIHKSSIKIVRGARSKNKVVKLMGIDFL